MKKPDFIFHCRSNKSQDMNESIEHSKKIILVVDDIDSIRLALCEYLEPEFKTYSAADGFEALEILENNSINIVLSDIRMPGMGGLQLFKIMQSKPAFREVQLVLMTAYNTDEYIEFVRQNQIWNIIPKSTNLDLHFVKVMLQKLASNSIFGAQKYFENLVNETINLAGLHRIHRHKDESCLDSRFFSIKIDSTTQNNTICDMIGDILMENGAPSVCRMILEELSANAIIHAPGIRKKIKQQMMQEAELCSDASINSIEIASDDAFDIGFGFVGSKLIMSVCDFHGSFDREAALSCLERQTRIDPQSGLPIGLIDYHGRGLFISRQQLDQLVFNIDPGERTEIIAIMDIKSQDRSRAISIYQI